MAVLAGQLLALGKNIYMEPFGPVFPLFGRELIPDLYKIFCQGGVLHVHHGRQLSVFFIKGCNL